MRIQKLKFCNINSLAGEFSVDFTHPHMAGPGIFVITGPTGSGKTSILDAISFALYGRSPRQGRFQTDENEIMSHGMAACFATVQYEQGGEHYLSTVSQARSKRGSNPFGQLKCELYRLSPQKEWKLLANKKSEFETLNRQITGLSFANFTRCMLLAQGEFAVFLKAGEKERAEILSTITGTEIYMRIGEVAHERVAAVQRQIDALHSQPEMIPEIRLQKEQARNKTELVLHQIAERKTRVQQCLSWLRRVEQQMEIAAKAEMKATQATQDAEDFKQNREPELRRAEAALAVKPAAVAMNSAQNQWNLHAEALTAAGERNRQSHLSLLEKQRIHDEALAKQKAVAPELEEQLNSVRGQMRPQEVALQHLFTTAQKAKEVSELRKSEKEKHTKLRQKLAANAEKARKILQQLTDDLQNVQQDAALAEQLPLLQARLADWEKSPASGMVLLPHEQIEEALCAARKALEKAESRPAGLREIAELKRRQLSIEEQLAALYLDFKAGRLDRCPCCGAEVPGERRAILNEEVQLAEQAVAAAESHLLACRRELAELEKMQRASLLRLAFGKALGRPVENLQEARDAVASLEKRRDYYLQLYRKVQAGEKMLADIRSALAVEETRAGEREQAAADADRMYADALQEYEQQHRLFTARWGRETTADILEKQLTAALNGAQKNVDSARKSLQQALLLETQAASALQQLLSQKEEKEKSLEESKDEFIKILSCHGFADVVEYQEAERLLSQLPELRARREVLLQKVATTSAVSQREAETLAQLKAANPLQEKETAASLAEEAEQLQVLETQQRELMNTLLGELRADDLAHIANAETAARRHHLETERNRHALLKKVLGDSQDGFKKYAQQITFDMLLRRANVELRHLTERYELRRRTTKDDPLGLAVIDHELGTERNASNLSGGESFLASLALALGLSHMAGTTRIDSLFLDEGFGTLDADTLDHVLTSLQKLRSGGKMIGIISHVQALSERIPAHIEVIPRRGGFSTLSGSPAVKAYS
ncbi:MAG: AAA family ATPase [Akkermansia sp.]|nr:AAA family ATPase [Akkermansia sp.]